MFKKSKKCYKNKIIFIDYFFSDILIKGGNVSKKIIKIILIIFVMTSIFMFSSDTGSESNEKSDSFIIKTAETLLGKNLSEKEEIKIIEKYFVPVRKSAHFFIYLLLGFLIISYIREFDSVTKRTILLSVLICMLYACSDEIHQLAVSGRSGELFDVIIDTLGSSVGVFSYYCIDKFKMRRCFNE